MSEIQTNFRASDMLGVKKPAAAKPAAKPAAAKPAPKAAEPKPIIADILEKVEAVAEVVAEVAPVVEEIVAEVAPVAKKFNKAVKG
jgi:hypothetical protein